MRDLFSFNGRLNRARYFLYSLLASVLLTVLKYTIFNGDSFSLMYVYMAVAILYIYTKACFIVKRLHDIGRPGYHYFLLLIPLYNIYILLVLLFQPGVDGSNEYGADPLQMTI